MDRQLAVGAKAASADDASKAGEAFGWGLLSATSLVLGAAIALVRLPSRVVRASLMAFGGGALLEALSIELFAHIIAKARGHGHGHGSDGGTVDRRLVFIALGSALVGGLMFAGLDVLLSGHGAFLRKDSTVRAYMRRLRTALLARLIGRLRLVPMFEVLETAELVKLAKSMVKERYAAGATIFRELSGDSSVFFVLSGSVDVTITTHYARTAPAGPTLKQDKPLLDGDTPSTNDVNLEVVAMDEVQDFFQLGPNDIFGEMALFTAETVQAKAVASKPSSVLRIPRSTLHGLLASNRRLQDFVTMTAIDRLRETEAFCHCTPSTVARLVSFMRQAEFEAGDVLFHDVDQFCPVYFVVLGCVEVVHGGQCGGHHIVSANGLLGTEHLLLGRAEHITATATERSTVLIVQRSDIDKLCARDERFRQALLRSAGASARLPGGAGSGAAPVALQPPEGSVAPARFGVGLHELGWHRQASPSKLDFAGASPTTASPNPAKASNAEETLDAIPATGGASGACTHFEKKDVEEDIEGGGKSLEASHNMLQHHGSLMSMEGELADLLASQNAAQAAKGKEGHGIAPHDAGRGVQAAIMIWLGILIDSVPESLVMGILVNTASPGTLLAFVVGVFLANFPEAMSSAGTMSAHGMRKPVIMLMWASIMLLTGIGAGIGAVIFPPGSTDDPALQLAIASIEGLCGGAMLCMIANTVLPEAFEQGGSVTGLSTLLGFIVAITVSVSQ